LVLPKFESAGSVVSRARKPANNGKRIKDDFDEDEGIVASEMDGSPQAQAKKLKVNRHGLTTLGNGVVSMRELELSKIIPSKDRYYEAATLFDCKLSWGQA
jgi:hypothetical protein